MKNLNLLVVEGNIQEENDTFKLNGIPTHAESLKESLSYYTNDLNIDVFNPCSEKNFDKILLNIKKYDGLIWGGSSLNIYNDCIEIKRQIAFMKECFKNIKKILAICWGMQVAVTAAGGKVKKSENGAHIGIANNIEINENGINHIWGLQYHPEITYHKMISLIKFRKDRLIDTRKCFKDEKEIQEHISFIEKEIKISIKESRMMELKNWLDYLKAA